METALNERAAAARPEIGLAGAAAVYLRQLSVGAKQQPMPAAETIVVPLPARIVDRLGCEAVLEVPAARGEVDSAVLWERAAVVAGRTMTEWALAETLAG